jgi:ankyrin repeat protein
MYKYGKTALHDAGESGNLEVLKALWSWAKEAQLKPNELIELLLTKDEFGKTVLYIAEERKHLDALWSWAKEAELKPNESRELLVSKDEDGNTAWHEAAKSSN